MRLIKWIFKKFIGEFADDAKWLIFFWIWRIVTVGLLFFGGATLLFASIIGGLFFSVPAATIFTWFAIALAIILAISLVLAIILFIIWFLRQNIWVLPLMIIFILVATIVAYSGQSYVVYVPTCGERVCFDDPSELGTLTCPGSCTECKQITMQYGAVKHTQTCGTTFDVACPTCGNKNSFVPESDFNYLSCSKCEKNYNLECSGCGAWDSLVTGKDSEYLQCAECDKVYEMICSGCKEVNYLTEETDINNLHCSKCDKLFDIVCSNCQSKNSLTDENGLNPLRCTECGSRNNDIHIVEEGGKDLMKNFRLRKLGKFIGIKFDTVVEKVKGVIGGLTNK